MSEPVELARTLAAFVDALIPGDADFPAASAAGTHGLVAERIRAAQGAEGVIALVEGLKRDGLLAGDRPAAVARFAASEPERFGFARFATYLAYYQTPAVIVALQRLGHDYNDAPQPLGYRMEPFDPERHAPKHRRGGYKRTAEIARLDLSPLADLELPAKEATPDG